MRDHVQRETGQDAIRYQTADEEATLEMSHLASDTPVDPMSTRDILASWVLPDSLN